MSDEFDLLETLKVLLKGKWVIAAVTALAVVLTIVVAVITYNPLFEATATIDATRYDIYEAEEEKLPGDYALYLLQLVRGAGIVDKVTAAIGNGLVITSDMIDVERVGNTQLLRIKGRGPDAEAINMAVELAGMAALELARDRLQDMLTVNKELLEEALLFFSERIESTYGDEGLSKFILDNQGNIVELDPLYRSYMEEKAKVFMKIDAIQFELQELDTNSDLQPAEFFHIRKSHGRPVNSIRWGLLVIAAFMLGLLFAVTSVLVHHHLFVRKTGELTEE